jgi:NAD(P)-dependent dehydrogenase (short-subunit alcohol dehydrogenase family)
MTKTVLITGTSSGYGKATAQLFLDRGWQVVATMRKPDRDLFPGSAEQLRVLQLDVTNAASIQRAIDDAIGAFGRIDVLVNNAGIGLLSAFEATPDAVVRELFETNTFGVMSVCRAVIPHMREHGSGTVINVTSSVGLAPMPLVAVYTASKWAIEGFSESLSYELELLGIRTKIVEPGLGPNTKFAANGAGRMQGLLPPQYGAFAQAYFARMADYPTAYASEEDVAETVFEAATDGKAQLRYAAGADTKMLASLRATLPSAEYSQEIRRMFVPAL